jgi:type IV pilus assembly protein PilB
MPASRKTLGEFLIDNKTVSLSQLQTAHIEADKTGEPLGTVLVRLGMIPADKVLDYFVNYCRIPRADLKKIDPQVIGLLPEISVRRYHLIPVAIHDHKLTVAMADPLNVIVIDELRFRTGLEVEIAVAPEEEIKLAINQHYGVSSSISDILKSVDVKSVSVSEEEPELGKLQSLAEEAPIIKLVNTFITQAFHDRASDLHIEPDENILRIRNRIDGVLYDVAALPKYLQPAVVSRAKIMADLNIAVKRAPQDGRFQINIEGAPIDVRVSTLPTIYGENVVLRLLDARSVLLGLDELGFTAADLGRFRELLKYPYGIILVTGPTGCGKTTTLYSALNTLNSPHKNIMTVEDPVEYRLFGIRQTQVNPKGGLTFASGLRSILRQDPDIIMVGEIRDLETAQIAVQAALTGHLVLSTLHTNDASSAITRLIDMGVEPFLVSSAIIGIVAQRLVRTICKECKAPLDLAPEIQAAIEPELRGRPVTFYAGKGCHACKEIGYRGRIGIFELVQFNEQLKELVLTKASASALKKAAQESGMKTLRENGITKAIEGATSLDEILQVTEVT